jgi:hypothetical protein
MARKYIEMRHGNKQGKGKTNIEREKLIIRGGD